MNAPKTLSSLDLIRLGTQAAAAGNFAEAERHHRTAFKVGGWIAGAANLAFALEAQNRTAEAAAVLAGAVAVIPDEPALAYRLSLALLRLGRYAEAWPLFEQRPVSLGGGVAGRPSFSFPEWKGEAVTSLLVLPEQGLGDQIMFARYLTALRARGIKVTVVCSPVLARLMAHLGVDILPMAASLQIPRCDAWVLSSSLPLRFATTLDTIPPGVILPSKRGGAGFGFAVKGNPGHPNDANRSLPPNMAAELAGLAGAVSLAPEDTGAKDLEDTRQLIEGLERVITVDTSVAHLAGAMGKPVWVLLPHVADWRWLENRSDSPWHPSARLFRQPAPGDWRSVLDAVKALHA